MMMETEQGAAVISPGDVAVLSHSAAAAAAAAGSFNIHLLSSYITLFLLCHHWSVSGGLADVYVCFTKKFLFPL